MGGKDPNRQPKLRRLRNPPAGWLWLASCARCPHMGPMPAEQLIRKYGEDSLIEFAMVSIKCTVCGNLGAQAKLVKLCEPGCAKQRG